MYMRLYTPHRTAFYFVYSARPRRKSGINRHSDSAPNAMFFSVIIPVYNRPVEIRELLESLTRQTRTDFEVLVIEDGSTDRCEEIVEGFQAKLDVKYHFKENSGQGFSRNYGFERASGDYYVVFDSDCLIPPHYFETVHRRLQESPLDAWGGPDRAHESFSILQKAISYAMTSPFTTGGIRGNRRHAGTFHPRSFNMGISAEVFERTGGYRITRMGEDIEFSLRIIEQGFSVGLIPEAWVYHKRRTSLTGFFKQLHFFGRARVNIGRFYPREIKTVHLLPSLFLVCLAGYLLLPAWNLHLFRFLSIPVVLCLLLILVHATWRTGSLRVGAMSMVTSVIQLSAYGTGFIREWVANLRK